MAIDPRIPLGVTPMNLESPTDQLGKAMNLRAAQAQMQSADMDIQAKERSLAEEQQLKALIQSGQPLTERNLFPVVGPTRGAAILKGLADLKGAQIKTEGELRAVMGSVIGAIKSLPENMRPFGYQTARQGFIQRGWAKPEDIPEQYSPELLDQFQQQAMTPEQQVTQTRLQEEHVATLPGKQANSAKSITEAEAAAISLAVSKLQAATNQDEWDIALADAPPAVKRQIPKTFSRAAVSKARQMGMTADQALAAAVAQQNANTSAFNAQTSRMTAERGPAESFQWAVDPRDGKVKLMSPQEIRASGASQAPTADMRNKEAARPAVQRGIQSVRNLGQSIFTKVGPAQRAEAMRRGVDAVFGNDPVFRTYQDARMATAGALAVEQQGARVSDDDVKALWLPMIPDAYRDTKESWDLKWGLIDDMRGVARPESTTVDGPVDKVWDPVTKTFKKVGGS